MMKKFQVKFTAKKLTGNAGLVHLGKFADKLQLPSTLKKVISIEVQQQTMRWRMLS
jgi:hypothetical protein